MLNLSESNWNPIAEKLRADPSEGLVYIHEGPPKEIDLTYEWRSNRPSGLYCEHGSYQRRLKSSEGHCSIVNPMFHIQIFNLRVNMTDLKVSHECQRGFCRY